MRDWILNPCFYIHKCLITFLVLDQPVERFPGLSLRDAASNSGKTPNINWSLLDVLLARNKKANNQQLPQKSISNHVPFWELYGYESEISKFQNQNVKLIVLVNVDQIIATPLHLSSVWKTKQKRWGRKERRQIQYIGMQFIVKILLTGTCNNLREI